ncbi:sialyltransferase-like protein 2 [Capsicum chacoense]
MMECLGLIKILSPMRANPDHVVKWLPSRSTITAARIASEKLLRRVRAGSNNLLATCSIIKKQQKGNDVDISNLGKAAVEHHKCVKGTTMYPLEHNPGHGQLCTVPNKLMVRKLN